MKFKKVAALTLVLSLTVSSAITNVFAEQNNTHYIKIERVTPGGKGFFKEGDLYSWRIHLNPDPEIMRSDLRFLGFGNGPSDEMLDGATSIIGPQDGIDIDRLVNEFDIDREIFEQDVISIPVTELVDSEDNAIPATKTTGYFTYTLQPNELVSTSTQTKDDNEQRAYLTINSITGNIVDRVWVRIKTSSGSNVTEESGYFTNPGRYYVDYEVNVSTGDRLYMNLQNDEHNPTLTIDGQWTP